ncbi:MAG: hypothetical protein GY771_11825 [bacterium]|nr:hypothetical protein [bacterium]
MSENTQLPCLAFIAAIQATNDLLGKATTAVLRDVGKKLAECNAPLDDLQGTSEEIKPGIFVQHECPFGDTTKSYTDQGRALPEAVKSLAEYANSKGAAWVSAYCGVHQTMREAFDAGTVQVACKGGDGSINHSENEVMDEGEAKKILKDVACVYAVR